MSSHGCEEAGQGPSEHTSHAHREGSGPSEDFSLRMGPAPRAQNVTMIGGKKLNSLS